MIALRMRVVPVLVLSLIALVWMWRPVVLGEVFLPVDALLHMHPWRYSYERVPVNNPVSTDTIKQIYPRRVWVNETLRTGQLPLWNPTVLTGIPNMADGQSALFYPPTWLLLWLPLEYAFGVYALLHLCLAGCGAFLLARQLALDRLPAFLAGLIYMLSGYLIAWLQFPHHTGAMALLPWCFWAVGRACRLRRPGAWLTAGVVLALPVLSHVQLAFYTYIAVAAFMVFHVLHPLNRDSSFTTRTAQIIAGFMAAIVLALALSAVQLLPSFELAGAGQRSDLGFTAAPVGQQLIEVLRLVFPSIAGVERFGPPLAWGAAQIPASASYVGLTALLLACVALLRSQHPARHFFGVLAVLAVLFAISSPLLEILMILVPPYRQFEDHTRWFAVWGLAVAMLAGMGAQVAQEQWSQGTPRHRHEADQRRTLSSLWRALQRWWLPLGVVLLGGGWVLWHVRPLQPDSQVGFYQSIIMQQPLLFPVLIGLASLLALGLWYVPHMPPMPPGILLAILIVLDIGWYNGAANTSYNPAIVRPTSDLTAALAPIPRDQQQFGLLYPPTRQIAFLQQQPGPFRLLGADYQALPPNLATAYGLEDIRGYYSLYPERYNRLARLIDGKNYRRTGEGKISLRAYFTSAYEQRRLLNMLNVVYLIFPPGSPNIERYAPLELVERNDEGTIYRNPQALPRAWLVQRAEIIPNDEAQLDRLADPSFDPATTVILDRPIPDMRTAALESTPDVSYAPNQVIIRARTQAPAMLVLSDAYSADWQVTVNGQVAQLYRANYAFRGVWLPAGDHIVVFTYRPQALMLGAIISGVALVLVVVAAVLRWRN